MQKERLSAVAHAEPYNESRVAVVAVAYKFRGADESGRTDKQRVRCSYCNKHVALWAQSRVMYKHRQQYPRDGSKCPGSGTNAFFTLSSRESITRRRR